MSIEQPLGGSVGGPANTITDRQLFDHANSDPDPAPAPSQPSQSPASPDGATAAPPPSTRPDLQQPEQPQAQPGQQPRTPEGKFAPKPQGQPQQQRQPEDHRVPLRELLAERDARQRLEAHAAELTRAVMELQQRTDPNRQQSQQPPETIFDNPDQYLTTRVMDPLRQEGQREIMKVKDGLSRAQANREYTPQVVNAALGVMAQFRQTPQGNFVFHQIMQSDHPYGELVEWHRQQVAYSAIGRDPYAWLRQQQQQWLDDPNAQRQMLERIRAKQANGGGNGAQGRPPNVQLPPSLSTVASTASRTEAPGDLSSQSLWSFANR
jgi:hypothetical protein